MSLYIDLLKNQIDVTRVPFSDRGSRLMVFRASGENHLRIRLAERLTRLQSGIDAYRRRPPFVRDLALIDSEGNPIDFNIETHPHALRLQTDLGDFVLVFQGEQILSFGLPAGLTAGLRFHVSPQFWEEREQGGALSAIHNLVYLTNAEPVHNQITPEEGGYTVEFIIRAENDDAIILSVQDNVAQLPEVHPFSTAHDAAWARWRDWFDQVPPVDEQYHLTYAYAWWIMANNLISPLGKVAYESMTPSKISYVGSWLWDSAMHTLAYRHVDPELARNQIRAMIDCQLPDGMLPDAVYDEGIIATLEHPINAEVTKPPILAWAVLKLHDVAPDLDFLEEVYVPLVRWNAWWFSMNDDDVDGLVQYNHPYSSGLDDSPLWDYGLPVESPDLNTYLCIQMASLAKMAELLGMDAEGAMWRRRSTAIVRRMIRDFWDEDAGLFCALHDEQPIPVVTPFNLYPLWTGHLPDEICQRLIAHLTNSREFWGQYAIPTVAYDDPHYNPSRMWRGPVWANINYFFIEALQQVGKHDLARTLREKTLHLIMDHPSVYEYYNSETGQPPAMAADTFGWTAAVFIDLAIRASREGSTE